MVENKAPDYEQNIEQIVHEKVENIIEQKQLALLTQSQTRLNTGDALRDAENFVGSINNIPQAIVVVSALVVFYLVYQNRQVYKGMNGRSDGKTLSKAVEGIEISIEGLKKDMDDKLEKIQQEVKDNSETVKQVKKTIGEYDWE